MRILVVDDAPFMRQYLTDLFDHCGDDCDAVGSVAEALPRLERRSYDFVISEIEMPGLSGLALAADVRCRYPELPVILTSSAGSAWLEHQSRQLGAAYLEKPFTQEDLLHRLGRR